MDNNAYNDYLYKSRSESLNNIMAYNSRKIELEKKMENCHPVIAPYIANSIAHCDYMIEHHQRRHDRLKKAEKDSRRNLYINNVA